MPDLHGKRVFRNNGTLAQQRFKPASFVPMRAQVKLGDNQRAAPCVPPI
jgi:hypothetical protein